LFALIAKWMKVLLEWLHLMDVSALKQRLNEINISNVKRFKVSKSKTNFMILIYPGNFKRLLFSMIILKIKLSLSGWRRIMEYGWTGCGWWFWWTRGHLKIPERSDRSWGYQRLVRQHISTGRENCRPSK